MRVVDKRGSKHCTLFGDNLLLSLISFLLLGNVFPQITDKNYILFFFTRGFPTGFLPSKVLMRHILHNGHSKGEC